MNVEGPFERGVMESVLKRNLKIGRENLLGQEYNLSYMNAQLTQMVAYPLRDVELPPRCS